MILHPIQIINFAKDSQFIIEASAGTGKTWTIERLFIKVLLEKRLSLEEILVVTFTNAAVNELKTRINEQIKKTIDSMIQLQADSSYYEDNLFFSEFIILRKYNLQKDISLLSRSLQNFDLASIYTIHSFCNKILKDYQIECHINYPFKLVEDKNELFTELVYNFFREKIINNIDFRVNIGHVYNTLARLFAKNSSLGLVESIVYKLPKDLFILDKGKFKLKYSIINSPDISMLLEEITPSNKAIVMAHFLSAVIEYLANYYEKYFHLVNEVSFNELIQIVADSVTNNSYLRNSLVANYPVAFIDEFQDTDSYQWQIFNKIYDSSGTLIVVGDPKQAIYSFRGADINVYLTARSLINNKLELQENRRSHPNIVNFINNLFNHDVNPDCFGGDIYHKEVLAKVNIENLINIPVKEQLTRVCNEHGVNSEFYDAQVHLVVIDGQKSEEKKINLLNALTFEILALLKTSPNLLSKIAILVNKNKEAEVLVKHFKEYGIKASELKQGSIFATPEAYDVNLILTAILNLGNRKLLLRAITSQTFNYPIDKLVDIETTDFSDIQKLFFNYKQIWETNGIVSLIYSLVNDVKEYSLKSFSNRELANLFQLGELLNVQDIKLRNPLEVQRWFKQKIVNAKLKSKLKADVEVDINGNSEELIRLDNDDEQIIITTQHKAKGLEYDILFCPYFKIEPEVDNKNDFSYQLPFFSKYKDDSGNDKAELIIDKELANKIIKQENKEIHRLNYVTLTRAKARIYIYLNQPNYTKKGYNKTYKLSKLVELFGYVADDSTSLSHILFNYPQFFTNDGLAIKNPENLPGVVNYPRNVLKEDLIKLKLEKSQLLDKETKYFIPITSNINISQTYVRQSYSSLTHNENIEDLGKLIKTKYKYNVLNECSGAKFGILFHELCEHYPLSDIKVSEILNKHNLNSTYDNELKIIINKVFSHKLMENGLNLAGLNNVIYEFEFNLPINKKVNLPKEIATLLAKYYGSNHPYVEACKSLKTIDKGFLHGFIDLFFEYDNKYWILDYKTNSLNDYKSILNANDINNPLVIVNAVNNYYLQYLLYLVAVKRYLQVSLGIENASNLIGGAIYYYVRGLFIEDVSQEGIYIDKECQNLIDELDKLL